MDTSLALPMTMTVKDNKGNLIASYSPSEPQWWITSWNPYKQDVDASDLRVKYTAYFSGSEKSKGMFQSFYKQWYGQDKQLTLENYTAILDF